jgi:predicted nuclease of predicted toxin-antitoxin system
LSTPRYKPTTSFCNPSEIPGGQAASFRIGKWLAAKEQEALHVLDVGLAEAGDEEIWKYASANSCALITKDEDFSRRATSSQSSVCVVWVRLGNCRTTALLAAFDSLLPQLLEVLDGGARLVEIR